MGCVIDHLQSDHRILVLQDFRDERGGRHRKGDTGILRMMGLDWARQEIVIEWEREGEMEKMFFALDAKEGPRSGHMRDFFAMEERVPPLKPTRSVAAAAKDIAPAPELVAEPISDPARTDEATNRIAALCARGRLDEAERQIQLILDQSDPYGGRLQELAGQMVDIAVSHAQDKDRTVFDWVHRRATTLWYAWGSGATSGGEGAARLVYIEAAEKRLAECQAPNPQ
jgi:hypothetical protein